MTLDLEPGRRAAAPRAGSRATGRRGHRERAARADGRLGASATGSSRSSIPGSIYAGVLDLRPVRPAGAPRAIPDHDLTNQALSGVALRHRRARGAGAGRLTRCRRKQGNWIALVRGRRLWRARVARRARLALARPGGGSSRSLARRGRDAHQRLRASLVPRRPAQSRSGRGPSTSQVFPYTLIKTKDAYSFIAGFSDVNWTGPHQYHGAPRSCEERFPTTRTASRKARQRSTGSWRPGRRELTSQEMLERVQDYMLNKRGPGRWPRRRLNRPQDTLAESHWWERGVFQKVEDPRLWRAAAPGAALEDVADAPPDQVGVPACRRRQPVRVP